MHTSKHLLIGSIVVAGILSTGDASAFEFGTPSTQHPFRSPQHFALEIRFSPYYPAVDDEPGLNGTPFKDRFGDKPRLLFGLEFDWQTVRIPYVGTLGPGVGVGSVSMSRPARTVTGNRPSGDEYGLTIYPMYAVAVLRVDTFWRGASVPLIPYVKAGLGLGLWDASNGEGTSRSTDGTKGSGATWGTQLALGLGLPLDVIDRGASRNMDNETGINTTMLFFEYYRLGLNGIGQNNALYVGSTTWAAGLAFEF